jgi:5-methylcytosine-specific restriction protein A
MPSKALRICCHPGCSELSEKRYCEKHRVIFEEQSRQRRERYDKDRGSPSVRGYNSKWRKARTNYLRHHPLCAECERHGRVVPATVVDHIIPHKGNQKLFWDTSRWQSLCKSCHDAKTAREDGGFGNRK